VILDIKDLAVEYNSVPAIDGLSIAVAEGEHVALVGPNGAGKTSLLKAISGTVRSTGAITFDGEPIQDLPAHERTQLGIIHVPEGRQVFGSMTIGENLRLGAYRTQARPRFQERLDLTFELFPVLADMVARPAATLSGGQQQMLAIARGLMSCPRLLLLDEPSMGLSPVVAEEVFNSLERLREIETTTVILVEQRALEAFEQCDRAYVVESGRISLEGATADLLADPTLASAYIGS
jgi:branched-chain amino acid transport system ATP-binding protein